MLVGVPKEIKTHEYRVGMTPSSVRELTRHGIDVMVETNAGHKIGLDDTHYESAGATIAPDADAVFERADMIVKVKEPQPAECAKLRDGQVLFTYLHLAPDPAQTEALLESGVIAIAYETVTDARGGLPLLKPMSEVAGRMSVQAGANCLEIERGGRGTLLGGVPGVAPGRVVVLGGGVVGTNAVFVATGMGAAVTVIDRSADRLSALDFQFQSMITTRFATADAIEEEILQADLVIGAVLVAGAAAPRLVSRDLVQRMKRGSVLVDVSIDQGGCFETSRPTTHADPTYIDEEVVHYCVTNMPGAVARTSTFALNAATLPFILALAQKGYREAMLTDPNLMAGLNIHRGELTLAAVGEAQGVSHRPAQTVLRP